MSGTASAQEWLKDRQNSEGAGVRVGDFEMHPGISVQGGYDSNWFMRTDRTGFSNSGVQGAPEMLVTPSISIGSLGGQRMEGDKSEPPAYTFLALASGTYHEFFGTLSPEQRNGGVDASMNLGILPGRSVSATINTTYDRIIQPSTVGDPDLAFTRDALAATADLAIQPGMDARLALRRHGLHGPVRGQRRARLQQHRGRSHHAWSLEVPPENGAAL
jgi:hypothetical protein